MAVVNSNFFWVILEVRESEIPRDQCMTLHNGAAYHFTDYDQFAWE
jgi:hypothetical protein